MVKPLGFLLEIILVSAQRLQNKTAQHTFQSLTESTGADYYDIICYRFVIICECVLQISDHYPRTFSRIENAQQIIGFRTWQTHKFHRLNPQRVWDCSHQHLEILVNQVQQIQYQLHQETNS